MKKVTKNTLIKELGKAIKKKDEDGAKECVNEMFSQRYITERQWEDVLDAITVIFKSDKG